jgi:hypothetical protein
MTTTQQDIIHSVAKQLEFMGGMILAWNTDAIEIGENEKDGIFYMIECLRKELKTIVMP